MENLWPNPWTIPLCPSVVASSLTCYTGDLGLHVNPRSKMQAVQIHPIMEVHIYFKSSQRWLKHVYHIHHKNIWGTLHYGSCILDFTLFTDSVWCFICLLIHNTSISDSDSLTTYIQIHLWSEGVFKCWDSMFKISWSAFLRNSHKICLGASLPWVNVFKTISEFEKTKIWIRRLNQLSVVWLLEEPN